MRELTKHLLDKHSKIGGCQHIDTMVHDLSADPHELESRFGSFLNKASASSQDFGLMVYNNVAYNCSGKFVTQDLLIQLLTVDVNAEE